ncbi:hypothetical protein ncot_19045 [Nocardioides sp. JQ2195]|uniref:hypothetical protein n=1 Tax=Nocardioides sp. JQ2195 TaxID=2592334 RepID=UPI00143E8106|nr:hypothetical protein [Nocardioides sp. JQ2195]QIX28454.1 hypothetical protein ncot_19045 [Nocardioides sp. JQ2195]
MATCSPLARNVPVAVAALALVTSALVGCSPDAPPSPSGAEPVENATTTLMQYTHDRVNRVLVVKIEAGDQPVRVQGVEVVSGAFSGTGPREYDATVSPHATLDLRVPLGDPVCDHDLSPADVSVEFRVHGDRVVVEEPAGSDTLASIHQQECAAKTAVEELPLVWGARWRATGAGEDLVLHAPLHVGPVSSGTAARLVAVEGSVIFVPETDRLPLDLAVGDTRLVDVRFRPNRCDAHVWETSMGFQFAARLRITGVAEDVLVPLVPPRPKQQLLTRSWQEQCDVTR